MRGRGGVNVTWDKWEEAREPLYRGIDDAALPEGLGIVPGMSFATTLLEKDSSIEDIGLVPCAKGGTNIIQWSRDTELYNAFLTRTEAALNLVDEGSLHALLWYQGESDANDLRAARLYKAHFQKFVSDLRFDLREPLFPIIEVAIVLGGKPELRKIVRAG
ncbi:hypothetical protein ACS0TY_007445 [Phlomoides rotata]